MAKHALYSPSSAKRWMTCPGSLALSKGREDKSSAYADEGTAAHFLAEQCLTQGCDAVAFQGKGIALWEHPESDSSGVDWIEVLTARELEAPSQRSLKLNVFTVDADMAEAVQVYTDYVRELVKSSGGILFVEVQVPLDHLTGEKDATGTSDTIIVAEEEVIIVDLKFGRGVEVSAIENEQMCIYGSGAIRYIDDLVGGAEKIKSVRMAISQPRVTKLPSEWACSIEDLRAFEEKVKCAANVCGEATTAFHDTKHVGFSDWMERYLEASEDACRFCRAKAGCPKVLEVIEEAIGVDFTNLNDVPAVTNSEDNELLSKHLAVIDFVEGWCKAVRAEGESQLLQGNPVPGYKLVKGKKGNRSWMDEALAERTLKKLKLKRDEMYETKLISPTTAEKVIGNTSEKWKQVQNLIVQKEGGLSVAPESDKRPAVELKPITDGFVPLD